MMDTEMIITRILKQRNYFFGIDEDGRQIFAHRESLIDPRRWEDLTVGARVRGIVTETAKGYSMTVIS